MPSRCPGATLTHVAAQPRDQPLHPLFVNRAKGVFVGRRRFRLSFDLPQHLDQHLSPENDGSPEIVYEAPDRYCILS